MHDNNNIKWVNEENGDSGLPGGCMSLVFKPFAIGLSLFSLLISLFMSLFGDSQDNGSANLPPSGSGVGVPYPYDPKDPTEGGKYPNPNKPGRPVTVLPPGKGGGSVFPVLPIDIIPDPVDSMRHVVGNRLNVLLEKENNHTGKDFMTEFKRLYPSSDYEFNYFDTLSYRLQMVVPPNKRNYLKAHLNEQMPSFDFLLFDEEVFGMHQLASDPDFSNKKMCWYFDAIHVDRAWETTRGDSNIVVAVVDNGFDLNHPEFTGKIVKAKNIPERNAHVFPIIEPNGNDHGTHVASTAIGWADNGHGVSGIAPNCKFMPVQVATADGVMPSTCVMDGVLYAIYNGASVINISLGPEPPEWFRALSPQLQQRYISADDQRLAKVWERIYHIADKHNCTVVVAAGNENILSGYASKARTDSVIVVSAVDQAFHKATFSNYGCFKGWTTNYSTVSAPGVSIYNAVNQGRYAFMQGTSMASPIVAGSVALLKSVNPDLKTEDVRQILQKSGKPLSELVGPLVQLDRAVELAGKWIPEENKKTTNQKNKK